MQSNVIPTIAIECLAIHKQADQGNIVTIFNEPDHFVGEAAISANKAEAFITQPYMFAHQFAELLIAKKRLDHCFANPDHELTAGLATEKALGLLFLIAVVVCCDEL